MRVTMPLRPTSDIESALREASAEIDEMLSVLSLGLRNQAQFDALEQRVQRLRARLQKAFRG